MAEKKIKRIKVNNIDCDVDFSPIGYVISPNGTEYTLKVDYEGNLYTVDEKKIPASGQTPTTPGQTLAKLYINSLYCGGKDANEHTLNYCSHNFVELSNLTTSDINLKGLSLQYAIDGTDWNVLPLEGVIKAGSTFVIRGAACSMYNSPTTKIKVDKYDLEWRDSNGELIKFDSNASAKFYLTFNLNKYTNENPYNIESKNVATNAIGYVDLVGIKGINSPQGYEGTGEADGSGPYYQGGGLSNTKLFRKYYSMDPGAKATKAIGKRVNANDWCYVDLTKENGELIPSIEVYRPMASFEGKTLFYDKTNLYKDKPSMITCSFGIQATDNGEGATRCFNWLTGDLIGKYIWIKRSTDSSWGEAHESFYAGDGRSNYTSEAYNRILKEYTNDTVIIAHKFIISGLLAGNYDYIAGAKNEDGTPKIDACTEIRHFIVRTNTEVNNGFSFCQTSDQQGFNWEEYRIWEAASKCIAKEDESKNRIEFMVNTGDMTQDGNRLYEWLDYFNAKTDFFNNMEEMATIGNNDLSHRILYQTLNNDDNDKVWHENITFFYTFELDPDNMPIFTGGDGNEYLIPSLYSFNYGNTHFVCINSEIKTITETSEFAYGFSKSGYFYPQIKSWCERDIANHTNDIKIAYCHEMPFTILVPKITETTGTIPTLRDGGSSANDNNPDNNVFWLSEFLQTHGFKLCIGGHKHTEASSWQILENVKYENEVRTVDSMHPIIVVNRNQDSDFYIGKYCVINNESDAGSTELFEYNGYKYPDKWFTDDTHTALKPKYVNPSQLCTFEMEEELPEGTVPVLYAMSQATSYKTTSNKELPGLNIPWLRYYFPRKSYDSEKNEAKPNAEQKYPFYTIWTVKNSEITGEVRKVWGAFNASGKFDINIDYPYVKKGISAADISKEIHSINGITSMSVSSAEVDERIITIKL